MFNGSDKPLISFIGYNLVVIPVGVILTPLLADYDPDLIKKALIHTSGFTGLMMLLGSSFPRFFQSIGRALFWSLLVVIVVELILAFAFGIHSGFFDWVVALFFCGYIGYDWARANQIPKTLDNAIDSAAALYLDIINLFIRLLRIFSRK
jgi:FtsH-binding integral membrane protein